MTVTDSLPGLPSPQMRPEFYAGVPLKRGFAWVIDIILIGLVTALVATVTIIGWFFVAFLFLVVGFAYRWITIANGSATLGMRMAAIELRTGYGEPFDASTAFMHTAGYTLSMMFFPLQFISVVLMLVSERGQGLSDHVLGTTAVNRIL